MPGLTTRWVADEMRAGAHTVTEGPETPITGGAFDSRRARPGDLFTAYPGEHTDGNLYVDAAFENGAVAAICTRPPAIPWPDRTIVVARDATAAAGDLGSAWRRHCGPRVVGITGTVGKTTAKEVTATVLGSRFAVHRSEGNMNSREGLPLALMSLRSEHEVSVLEMGMDRPGEILELCDIAEPEVGVVLNIGLTHVVKLGSIDAIAAEKLSLPRYLGPEGTAVLNADDPRVAAAADGLACRVITTGAAEGATLQRGPITDQGLQGTTFTVRYGEQAVDVHSPLPGAHLVPAAMAALGAAVALDVPLAEAAAAISLTTGAGRLATLPGRDGATILDDRYNSSPASLAGALGLLATMPGRRIAFIGKMAELGNHTVAEHENAGRIAAASADTLVTVGEDCRALADGARAAGLADVRWFATRDEAAAAVRTLLAPGVYVLVKGSRSEELELALPQLVEGDA